MTMTAASTAERRASATAAHRDVSLQPGTWNPETRTLDVVWTTGARGARFDWDSFDMIEEELATAPQNVRLDRLNNGAPVLNTHDRSDLGSQIGVVVPGSARMQGGQGIATLQLSARADLAPIVGDIAAGIIRNLSVGYVVYVYEVEQPAGRPAVWRAIDWEPTEVSFVPVPFDAQAQVRSAPAATHHSCIIRTLNRSEPIMTVPASSTTLSTTDAPVTVSPPATLAQLRAMATDMGTFDNLTPEACSHMAVQIAERGMGEAEARVAMLAIMGERQRMRSGGNAASPRQFYADVALGLGGGPNATFDNPTFHARAIEDALYARMSGRAPTDQAREFAGMTMVQLAGEMLSRNGVANAHRMAPNEVLSASAWNRVGARAGFVQDHARAFAGGMHTTSDFPDLLTAAGQRFLLDMFAAAASPLKTVARQRSARDFRQISGLQLSGFGTLVEVPESGEIKSGTFKSRKESYALKTFAKQFSLSRQAIINDDLGAFGDPIRLMARASAETEASLLAQLIDSNPIMADGKPLFHASHGNLAPVGAAPSVETLDAGRFAMRMQKDDDGVTPLATAPKYILSAASDETLIEKLISSPLTANQVDNANPFAGKLAPLVDPRLGGDGWYLFADPALSPVLEYAYLDGEAGPHVEMQEAWDTLGTAFRVYMDFGAGVVDSRGAYKNPGAAPA
ncbi:MULTISPECIES: prohead protease/major capsid protein fusion protein [unclassified Sphingomonas]|uniref:prohead protease/major capsid protein fusion protein n=1 Tax=unclassified Sphingomonas TaxID=196159 RepID=UPI002269AEE1|nr:MULTISPECIES: prohead protease/major capsid protein fusion protein [unclassified Sphingomonas]